VVAVVVVVVVAASIVVVAVVMVVVVAIGCGGSRLRMRRRLPLRSERGGEFLRRSFIGLAAVWLQATRLDSLQSEIVASASLLA